MVETTRRSFLKSSSAAAIGTAAALKPALVHAAGSDVLRIGLVGCGGRGAGAARQALQADKNVKLTAMADVFEDRLQSSRKTLLESMVVEKVDVPADRQFVGFDAYKQLLASGVDVVLLATPPHFRPAQFKAAIDAGVHVFAEKPVAVDAPGVRSVMATAELAKKKNLSVVSGLCLRFGYGFQETIRRIHDGAIGDVFTLQANDYRGTIWYKKPQPDWTEMHNQMRNWYYYTWLSGDFNVEQHVHFLDICSWVIDDYPKSAVGMGGRIVRNAPKYGNIFDHHSVVYEYQSGAKLFSNTRQIAGCKNNLSATAVGTKGSSLLSERRKGLTITPNDGKPWVYEGENNNFYQTEHDELFASIRNGKPINNGEYMAKSTLVAIMGRMATYTGQEITWQAAMNSKQDLSPPKYQWGDIEMRPVAQPGVTKFV